MLVVHFFSPKRGFYCLCSTVVISHYFLVPGILGGTGSLGDPPGWIQGDLLGGPCVGLGGEEVTSMVGGFDIASTTQNSIVLFSPQFPHWVLGRVLETVA